MDKSQWVVFIVLIDVLISKKYCQYSTLIGSHNKCCGPIQQSFEIRRSQWVVFLVFLDWLISKKYCQNSTLIGSHNKCCSPLQQIFEICKSQIWFLVILEPQCLFNFPRVVDFLFKKILSPLLYRWSWITRDMDIILIRIHNMDRGYRYKGGNPFLTDAPFWQCRIE